MWHVSCPRVERFSQDQHDRHFDTTWLSREYTVTTDRHEFLGDDDEESSVLTYERSTQTSSKKLLLSRNGMSQTSVHVGHRTEIMCVLSHRLLKIQFRCTSWTNLSHADSRRSKHPCQRLRNCHLECVSFFFVQKTDLEILEKSLTSDVVSKNRHV